MRQDERAPFTAALETARAAAYRPGQYVGQESFMGAGEILDLARRAGVRRGTRVLDVCCGVAGPGRLVTAALGCDYLGVDHSRSAVEIARRRTEALRCAFRVASVPPLPDGPFDVVMLLETLLAFPDRHLLLREVARVLRPAGRFALTVEAGDPLSADEARAMPDDDTVWPVGVDTLIDLLDEVGLEVTWHEDHTDQHREQAAALLTQFRGHADSIAAQVGRPALDDLVDAHALWVSWLGSGRVRKYALVAQRRD